MSSSTDGYRTERHYQVSVSLREKSPELADELLHKELGDFYAWGSSVPLEWICPEYADHIYLRTPVSRVKHGYGCTFCAGLELLVGFNDLATTHPELAARLADPDVAKTIMKTTRGKFEWFCPDDFRHPTWHTTVFRDTFQACCPTCRGFTVVPGVNDLATTHPDVAESLVDQSRVTTLTAKNNGYFWWKCLTDSRHQNWYASVANRTACPYPRLCPVCLGKTVQRGINDFATTHPEFAGKLVSPEDAFLYTAGSECKILWQCDEVMEHQWRACPQNVVLRGRWCPTCAKSGFKMDKPAYVYLVLAEDVKSRWVRLVDPDGRFTGLGSWEPYDESSPTPVLQFGITNNLRERVGKHVKHGFSGEPLGAWRHESGRVVKDCENSILAELQRMGVESCFARGVRFSGSTESVFVSDISVEDMQTLLSRFTSLHGVPVTSFVDAPPVFDRRRPATWG